MTRTAKSARLSRHMAEPYAEIHPADAARLGVAPASLVTVRSPFGRAVVRALVTERTPEGAVFSPMHWTSRWSSEGRVDAVVGAHTDPVSGQPESKAQPVAVDPFVPAWYGFAVSRNRIRPSTAYWALARADFGWQAELAHDEAPEDWIAAARALLGAGDGAEPVSLISPAHGIARIAFVEDGRLAGAFFAAPEPVEIARAFVGAAVTEGLAPQDLLAGRPGADRPDPGPTVCSCFDVGANTIIAEIASQGLADVEAVGRALQAGTNCGSCRPEIAALIAAAPARDAAA